MMPRPVISNVVDIGSGNTGLPHAVQGERKSHRDEAGQAQDVHSEENIPFEHWLALSLVRLRDEITAFATPCRR
jgi:hypothetical protein